MTIEIHKPELERMVREEIASGNFQNVDDLLTHALRALRAESNGGRPTSQVASTRPSNRLDLMAILDSNNPIWKSEDHPDIDDAGDWVRQMRKESDRAF